MQGRSSTYTLDGGTFGEGVSEGQESAKDGGILSVMCTNMQFLTYNQHIIPKFLSQMPNYTHQKFHRRAVGSQTYYDWEAAPLEPPLVTCGMICHTPQQLV